MSGDRREVSPQIMHSATGLGNAVEIEMKKRVRGALCMKAPRSRCLSRRGRAVKMPGGQNLADRSHSREKLSEPTRKGKLLRGKNDSLWAAARGGTCRPSGLLEREQGRKEMSKTVVED